MKQLLKIKIIESDPDYPLLNKVRDVVITGNRNCETLLALINAGKKGITPLERWAAGKRLSHYIYRLRGWGLNIETITESDGGDVTYGRYVLHSTVMVIDPPDIEAA